MFYTMNQKTSKSIQTTKKLKLPHENFRQSQFIIKKLEKIIYWTDSHLVDKISIK